MHAINNVFGQSILSQDKFLEYCDEFDKHNHCTGSREYFFIHSNDNIISYILQKLQIQSSYYPPDSSPNLNEDSSDDIRAVIIFDDGHIWCVKKHDDIWYELDSVSNGPKPIEFPSIFSRQGFGWIIVWNENRSIANEQVFQSNIANQPAKSSLSHERRSRRL